MMKMIMMIMMKMMIMLCIAVDFATYLLHDLNASESHSVMMLRLKLLQFLNARSGQDISSDPKQESCFGGKKAGQLIWHIRISLSAGKLFCNADKMRKLPFRPKSL